MRPFPAEILRNQSISNPTFLQLKMWLGLLSLEVHQFNLGNIEVYEYDGQTIEESRKEKSGHPHEKHSPYGTLAEVRVRKNGSDCDEDGTAVICYIEEDGTFSWFNIEDPFFESCIVYHDNDPRQGVISQPWHRMTIDLTRYFAKIAQTKEEESS